MNHIFIFISFVLFVVYEPFLSNSDPDTKFKKGMIQPPLIEGLLEMTEPDSHNSPTQKYRTTTLGKQLLESKAYDLFISDLPHFLQHPNQKLTP